MNNIIIPEQLRKLIGGQRVLMLELKDITELIERLSSDYPNVKERLINKNGELNRFVNVYVNGEDIRFLENITTK